MKTRLNTRAVVLFPGGWRHRAWPMLTGAILSAVIYGIALARIVASEKQAVAEMRQFRVACEARLSEVVQLQREQIEVCDAMMQCLLRSNLNTIRSREFTRCVERVQELTGRQESLIRQMLADTTPYRGRAPRVVRDLAEQYLHERKLCFGLQQLAVPLEAHTAQMLNLFNRSEPTGGST